MKKRKIVIGVIIVLILGFGMFFVFKTIMNKDGKGASANLADLSTATPTVYKDFSELTEISNDYSYSTLFYSKNTKFYANSDHNENVWYRTDSVEDNVPTPYVRVLEPGDTAEVIITNCAIDDDNNVLDVVFKITMLEKYEPSNGQTLDEIPRGDFTIRPNAFNNGEQSHPKICEGAPKDGIENCSSQIPVNYGDPLDFGLGTYWASVKVELTYYKDLKLKNVQDGRYTHKLDGSVAGLSADYAEVDYANSVVATNIKNINSIYADLDTVAPTNAPDGALLGLSEGVAPLNGSTTLYYNKINKDQTFTYPGFPDADDPTHDLVAYAKLAEGYNGIYIDQFHFRYKDDNSPNNGYVSNVTGKWYGTTAELLTNNVNGKYEFVYSGRQCGIYFSFMSPTGYTTENPVKKVSKTSVTPGEIFNFEVSQYIPNNYYSHDLGFYTVFPNLNSTNRISSLAFSDEINSNLVIDTDNIVVEDVNGNNLSAYYNVSVSNNKITVTETQAASTYYNTAVAYNNIITLKIPVKYVGKVEREITIPNTGLVALGMGSRTPVPTRTNTVEVKVKPLKLTYDCVTNGGEATFDPITYAMYTGENVDLSYKCTKPEYDFVGWSTTPDGDPVESLTMPNVDTTIYGIYEPHKCDMTISSSKYRIDTDKKTIYVEKDETVEEIKKNIKSNETLTVTKETVTIDCKDLQEVYKIERYWIPKTGQTVVKYGLIIGIVLVVLGGLIFIVNKMRK